MDIFTRFKTAIKIREVQVDNNIFQLHYRVTAVLLLICAALVASKQHFGDPIDCITRDDVPNKIMDTYCWIHSTFTLPDACNKTVGIEVPHPCVDKSNVNHQGPEDRVYHKYYQWVYFVLFFQAVCFYAPHFLWKSCESKLLAKLCSDLKDPLFQEDEKTGKAKAVVRYFERHCFMHRKYFYYFILFEVVNFLNVILQMYIVDVFLGGTFTTYGLDVLNYSQLDQFDRVDPMVRVFPRMTKCTFHRFGASGDVQRYDALCILPLNIINEKIYIMMWFWFVFLAIVSVMGLIYRLVTYTKPGFRYEILRRRAPFTDRRRLNYVLKNTDEGDWFLLYMVCKNIDSNWFGFIIKNLSIRLEQMEIQRKEAAAISSKRSSARCNNNNNKLSRNGNSNQANRLRRHNRDDGKDMILTNDDYTDSDTDVTMIHSSRSSRGRSARTKGADGQQQQQFKDEHGATGASQLELVVRDTK